MGLDMYLYENHYLSDGEWLDPEKRETFRTIAAALKAEEQLALADSLPHILVDVQVAYWRKANAVHAWFVEHCQSGVDECQKSYVSEDNLKALLSQVKEAIALYEEGDKVGASDAMTPVGGFFFGNTDVDEYWLDDMKHTVKMLQPLADKGGSYYYQSSW